MLHLTMLGGLGLESGHGLLAGAALRHRPLAILALAAASTPGGVSRDKVLAYLWPESDGAHSHNCLRQTLFAIRRDLGHELFLPGSSTLRLDPGVLAVDRWEFEQALARRACSEAVDAYHGPFLDGFHVAGLAEFERWTERERDRLAHRYQGALEALVAEADSAGDWVGAVEWWSRLTALDPLSSRFALGLMRALVRAGDCAEALRHAAIHERLLREELEVVPDTGERVFVERLRRSYAVSRTGSPSGPR
jgi:DNA-binding SARP family transcriptional activator